MTHSIRVIPNYINISWILVNTTQQIRKTNIETTANRCLKLAGVIMNKFECNPFWNCIYLLAYCTVTYSYWKLFTLSNTFNNCLFLILVFNSRFVVFITLFTFYNIVLLTSSNYTKQIRIAKNVAICNKWKINRIQIKTSLQMFRQLHLIKFKIHFVLISFRKFFYIYAF